MGVTVYAHVGTRKSGTTTLQEAFRSSRDALDRAGYALPLIIHDGSDKALRRLKRIDSGLSMEPVLRVMRTRLAQTTSERVLISNEFLAEIPAGAVDLLLGQVREQLGDARIVLLITARPWSKVIGSEWQESIKTRALDSFADRVARIRAGQDPRFLARHDLPGIVRRWGRSIDPEDVHVIAVPRPGGSVTLLDLFCSVIGLDPAVLKVPGVDANQSLTLAQAELVRRISVTLGERMPEFDRYPSAIRHWLVPVGFVEGRGTRPQLSGDFVDWCAGEERRQLEELRQMGCTVVGDPADLTPSAGPRDVPMTPSEEEVTRAAVEALAALVSAHRHGPTLRADQMPPRARRGLRPTAALSHEALQTEAD